MKTSLSDILLSLILLAGFGTVRAESRLVESFNDNWYFVAADTLSEKAVGEAMQVQLPHTWNTDAYSTN